MWKGCLFAAVAAALVWHAALSQNAPNFSLSLSKTCSPFDSIATVTDSDSNVYAACVVPFDDTQHINKPFFLFKADGNGTMMWSRYFGSGVSSVSIALALDGTIWVGGTTIDSGFPTTQN